MPKITPTLHRSGCYSIGPSCTSFGREVVLVNTRDQGDQRFVFWFGGDTYLMSYGWDMERALEEAIDWIVDHAPGLLHDDAVEETYREAIAEGKSEEEAIEEAEMDMTSFGHSGMHYLASWEWGIALENPTREELIAFLG